MADGFIEMSEKMSTFCKKTDFKEMMVQITCLPTKFETDKLAAEILRMEQVV
jgi:hypothetical protein